MALKRWEVKVLCMFALFISMSIFVLLPIKVAKAVSKQGKRGLLIISVLSCFGGGVFFGAFLTHMNPDVRMLLNEALMEPRGIEYPLPELFTGIGFFIILFLEKFVLLCRDRSEKKAKNNTKTASLDLEKAKKHDPVVMTQYINGGYVNGALESKEGDGKQPETAGTNQHDGHRGPSPRPGYENIIVPATCCTGKHPEDDVLSVTSITSKVVVTSDDDRAQTRSIIFMVAMSLDCVFEGMALGLMYEVQNVIDLFVAIISHEFIMSFSIGMELVKYNKTKAVVAGGLTYAFTPVIGAVIGTCIVEIHSSFASQNTVDIVTGILQSMSAGTFIYCSFLGILKENLNNDHGILKSCVVLLGFGLMAGMAAITGTGEPKIPAEVSTVAMTASS